MNINYLASPSKGAMLTAEASEINKTKRTAVYDIRATDDSGKLLATCQHWFTGWINQCRSLRIKNLLRNHMAKSDCETFA